MHLRHWLFAALLPCTALAAAGGQGAMSVSSSSFTDGGVIALQQVGQDPACGAGEERTPQLSWDNLPAGTRSLALIMFDPDGGKGVGVVHWVAYNIDPEHDGLKEGMAGVSGPYVTVGRNSRGTQSYRGPCPPMRRQPPSLRPDPDCHRPALGYLARGAGPQRPAATAARPRPRGAEPGRALRPLNQSVQKQMIGSIAFIH